MHVRPEPFPFAPTFRVGRRALMPVPPSFPGVYIEEPPGPRHPIAGVSTSIAAFVGTSPRGPDNTPIRVLGQADYDRIFGGLETSSAMGFAVRDFFLNGGTEAFIIRVVPRGAEAATITIAAAPMPAPMPATTLILTAGSNVTGKPRRSRGPLDGTLTATVTIIADNRGASPARASVYDLTILYTPSNSTNAIIEETYDSISTDPESPRNLMAMLSTSGLVIADVLPEMGFLPAAGTHPAIDPGDGGQVGDAEIVGDTGEKTGIHALLQLQDDVFNLLCIPTPVGSLTDLSPATLAATARFCLDQRACSSRTRRARGPRSGPSRTRRSTSPISRSRAIRPRIPPCTSPGSSSRTRPTAIS